MVQLQDFKSKGTVRLIPKSKQLAYCKTYEYKGHKFLCFRNRGMQISKNLTIDYNKEVKTGEMVATQPFDYKEIVEHFKREGFEVLDETKKEDKKKVELIIEESKKDCDELYHKEITGKSTAVASVAPNK